MTGHVKWYDPSKGIGFIHTEEGNDLFVHYSNINDIEEIELLEEGELVEFDIEESNRGPHAVNVKKIDN